MAIIYAVINQKGGVGKSTTAFDIAAALAEDANNAVLLVDNDPQGHATEGIGLKSFWLQHDVPTLYQALLDLKAINPQELIQIIPGEKFFAIPSNFQMMELDKELTKERSRETRLYDMLQYFSEAFTHIVIDSPSYFGNLTDNILRVVGIPINGKGNLVLERDEQGVTKDAKDQLRSGVVIPIQAEQTSIRAFELLLNQIKVVESDLKIKVNILAMVPNLVQASRLATEILQDFRSILEEKMAPFEIPKKVIFQEAYKAGKTIFTYDPKDREKAKDVEAMRQSYRDLIKLLRERGEEYAGSRI